MKVKEKKGGCFSVILVITLICGSLNMFQGILVKNISYINIFNFILQIIIIILVLNWKKIGVYLYFASGIITDGISIYIKINAGNYASLTQIIYIALSVIIYLFLFYLIHSVWENFS